MKPLGHKQIIEHELEGFGIRLNKKPPNIYFKQKEKGGLALSVQCPQSELDKELVAVRFSILHQQQNKNLSCCPEKFDQSRFTENSRA